jgi:hypothetical protein
VRFESLDAPADTIRSALSLSNVALRMTASTVHGVDAAAQVDLRGGSLVIGDTTMVQPDANSSAISLEAGATLRAARTLLQSDDASTVPLCGGVTQVQSEGYNLVSDTSCGLRESTDRIARLNDLDYSAAIGAPLPSGSAIDGGGLDCAPVDLRGAPRPQTLIVGATARCDIGAVELGVNPYRGIWQPSRSGHGVELHTAGNRLMLIWYTYGENGQPTSYQAVAPLTGAHWEADLLQPQRDPASGTISTRSVGRVSLDFASDTDARLGWRFTGRDTTGSERIRPVRFATGEPRFETSGVWYAPADSGYGVSVTRRGEVTAAVLYYYDAAGHSRWVLGTGPASDAVALEMSSFTGFCPDCDAAAMPVTMHPAGRMLLHFLTPERARLDTLVTFPGSSGGQWIRDQASLVPLNDPVDNRAQAQSLAAKDQDSPQERRLAESLFGQR